MGTIHVSNQCPRCDGALERLQLGGADAVSCADCGYVGVEADHTGEPEVIETWDDAIRRFENQHRADGDDNGTD